MCKPIHKLPLPPGLETSCDAVASFYLHDKQHANEKLFESPDVAFFQKRQDMIEHLKGVAALRATAKRTLDVWLWGKAQVAEVWDNRVLATLRQDLDAALNTGGQWSLQILPRSMHEAGHHMALGQSPNGQNWWLLDPASSICIFNSREDLTKFTLRLLIAAPAFNFQSRTVLLKITPR